MRRRCQRERFCNFTKLAESLIKEYLILHWSPEKISATLKDENEISISHELIYQCIDFDRNSGC